MLLTPLTRNQRSGEHLFQFRKRLSRFSVYASILVGIGVRRASTLVNFTGVIMDWQRELKSIDGDLKKLRPAIADVAVAFGDLAREATKPGALDVKTKELIALAIGIAKQCEDCIVFHTKAAIMHGATRDEISDTIGMCVYMGGGPSLMYGAKALSAFDTYSKAD